MWSLFRSRRETPKVSASLIATVAPAEFLGQDFINHVDRSESIVDTFVQLFRVDGSGVMPSLHPILIGDCWKEHNDYADYDREEERLWQ